MASQTGESGDANLVEVKGRTVDEAVARGLVRLGGVGRSDVHIEIVSTGKSGVLGFGHEEAMVRMRLLAPGEKAAPAAASSEAAPARAPEARPGSSRERSPRRPRTPSTEGDSAPPADVAPDAGTPPRDEAPRRRVARDDTRWDASESEQAPRGDDGTPWDAPLGEEAPRRPAARDAAPTRSAARDDFERRTAPRAREDVGADAGAAPSGPRAGTAEDEEVARGIVNEIMTGLGFKDVAIERMPTLLPDDIAGGEEPLILAVQAPGIERLLQGGAAPLQALQLLVRLILNRRAQHWISVMLEVNGDRARRMRELCQLAEQSAGLVEREGRPVSLPPMSAYERRVVHLALQEHPLVATQSIGLGDHRKVTVRRKDQLLPDLS